MTPGDAREGLRWLWQRPFFRLCALLFAASNPVFSGLYLLVVDARQELRRDGPTLNRDHARRDRGAPRVSWER